MLNYSPAAGCGVFPCAARLPLSSQYPVRCRRACEVTSTASGNSVETPQRVTPRKYRADAATLLHRKGAPVSFRNSYKQMAIEKASSPVAQPATQTRMAELAAVPG
jgi:hypothetical protein